MSTRYLRHGPIAGGTRKEYYQFAAIVDCTRLRVLRIYDRLNQKTAIAFAGGSLSRGPARVTLS